MHEPEPERRPEPERQPEGETEEQSGAGRWLRPYFEDSALWPILLVALTIFVSFGAALLVLGVVERRVPALAALAVLLVLSVDLVQRELRSRGFGLVTGSVLVFWGLSALAAFLLQRSALF